MSDAQRERVARNLIATHLLLSFLERGTVMVRSPRPRLWQVSHPYSLSLPYDGKRLRLSVKAVGDFSSAAPSVPSGTPVILEGSYELFTGAQATSPKVLCTVSSGFVTRDYLQRVVPDAAERDVFLCGPPVVMRMLSNDLAALGEPAARVFAERSSLH